eukprot:TRINITY_DN6668_c0_g1_i1.p1 TRINITY_DN6668_c0_g1~~TRINITY_DN6668_c0_g1_i1.p1  ORF type:complete len:357 (-),score=68.99 TRINITY_DN6668_c0_g1_i1:530-1600(-)
MDVDNIKVEDGYSNVKLAVIEEVKIKKEEEAGDVRLVEGGLGKVTFCNLAEKEFYMSNDDNETSIVFCLDDKNREGSVTLQFESSITVLFYATFTCKGESYKPSIFPIQHIQKGNPIRLLIEKPEELAGKGRGSTQTLTLTIYLIDVNGLGKRKILSEEFHLRILKTVKQNSQKFSKVKAWDRLLNFSGEWSGLTEEEKGISTGVPATIPPAISNGSSTSPSSRKRSRGSMEFGGRPKRKGPSQKKPRLDPVLYNQQLDREIFELSLKCDGLTAVIHQLERTLEVVGTVRSNPVMSTPSSYSAQSQLIHILGVAAEDGALNRYQQNPAQEVTLHDPPQTNYSFVINTNKDVPQQMS